MSKLFNIFLVLLIVAVTFSLNFPVQATTGQASPENTLLQFTSGGHVLGFTTDGIYVAAGDHALKVEFVNSLLVQPVAAAAGNAQGTVAPLGRVTYSGAWKDVDIVYTAATGGITESTYYLNATESGLPVDNIRLRYNRPVSLDGQGNLVIAFDKGNIVESAPVAWQELKGQRTTIKANYVIYGEQEVGFALAGYQPGIPVVIDPVLTWLTFLGGSFSDNGYGIAVDGAGNAYVVGRSSGSWGNPVRAYTAGVDAWVAKLTSNGKLVWNTFLGGSGADYGYAIALDTSNNICIAGTSDATWGGPVNPYTLLQDAFAAKLDNKGNLLWNTFMGGNDRDEGRGITVAANGNIYVCGWSEAEWGAPKRPYADYADAFVAGLNSSGDLLWNTFLGNSSGGDIASDIAVDPDGNPCVAGESDATWGTPIREHTTSGTFNDAFAAKLSSNGDLLWNTFLGSSANENGNAIAVDSIGNIWVAGSGRATWGSPVQPFPAGATSCSFVARLDNNGAILWNTFVGKSCEAYAIAVGPGGTSYIAGYAWGTWGSPLRAYNDMDAFVAEISGIGKPGWNTFLGASAEDQGNGIAVDSTGNVYVAGYSESTWGSPLHAHTAGTSERDAFVVKISKTTPAHAAAPPSLITPHGSSMPVVTTSPLTQGGPVSMASISVRSASLSSTKVAPGSPVTVTADVVNTGTANGSSSIQVYVNGQVEAKQGITVNSGSSTPLTFTVSRNEPGTYSVYVGGTSAGSFTVDQFTPQTILIISGALVFFAFILGIIYIVRRRFN